MADKIRVAFVKFGGLSVGGTEMRLQINAANLPKDQFEVDYYYCDAAPYVGSDYKHGDTAPERVAYMRAHNVNLIPFHVKAKDITTPTHDWVGTDFWSLFDANRYDIIQAGKAGHAEYPFYRIDRPVVEFVGLAHAGVDHSPNIAWTFHCSPWQWGEWYRRGGRLERVNVIPNPALPPCTAENFRRELGIAPDHRVAGLIQRADNHIFSPMPLAAFLRIARPDRHFVIMGGGSRYRDQAQALGLRNVHFIPQSGDPVRVSTFFNTLDFFAHGRRDGETYGTVFAEAMMHGKPCLSHYVADGNNGQQETMGPCGFFARTIEEYAARMETLFSDDARRAALAAKARKHAEDYFSLERGMDDLIDIYRRVAGRTPLPRNDPRMPYALSPLGFNYAGPIGTPGALANHAITGEIPEEAAVHLMRFFIPQIRTFLEVGAGTGLYGFVAAHEGSADLRAVVFEPQADSVAALRKTVWLNNWEERVTVVPVALGDQTEEVTLDRQVAVLKLPRVDAVKIDTLAALKGARGTLERDHPVVLVKNSQGAETLKILAAAGYRVWRCSEGGDLTDAFPIRPQDPIALYIALHEAAHAPWFAPMRRWMRRYRWRRRLARGKKLTRLLLRAGRHPRQGLAAWQRYRANRGGGFRF